MKRISAATRISIGLVGLTISALLTAQMVGLLPDPNKEILDGRKKLCETVAVGCALAVKKDDRQTVEDTIASVVQRNDDVLSAAVRDTSGTVIIEAGPHSGQWEPMQEDSASPVQAQIPIFKNGQRWATVELRFARLSSGAWWSFLDNPVTRLLLFVGVLAFIAYMLYLRKVLQHLDPSSVIPDRVKAVLNTLAEGVLILDRHQRIVLANKTFSAAIGAVPQEMQGRKAESLPWMVDKEGADAETWQKALLGNTVRTGVALKLARKDGGVRSFMVNSAPITAPDGTSRGVLATFDDVTSIEEKNVELQQMLSLLKDSRDEVDRQNRQLQVLAHHDPLTGLLNRRAFFEQAENRWSEAKRHGYDIACIMVDIDHFKEVNDYHGHAMGDNVLKVVANAIKERVRDGDIVCRYGGEEFCVLLSHATCEEAAVAGERFRTGVEGARCGDLQVTASLGVCSTNCGGDDLQDLIGKADAALYFAKDMGRNQVRRWDLIPSSAELEGTHGCSAKLPGDSDQAHTPIPLNAVHALLSALRHRDPETAGHSQRVGDLCVSAAEDLMPSRKVFTLEIAALLHDIGKLGVPDAILLKPGRLTEEEWEIMHNHDRMGVEIIESAFASPDLTNIVRHHHAWFGGNPAYPGLPEGEDIPLPARILSIADAFDAMVSDRPYRKAMSHEDAFEELRRCAGTQFDPDLVERFISTVLSDSRLRNQADEKNQGARQKLLQLSLEVERLACSLDARDLSTLSAIALSLVSKAQALNAPVVAQMAETIHNTAAHEKDILSLVSLTNDLMKHCRKAQQQCLDENPLEQPA
ncbi:MAG: diguanylate cyclase [Phycisphaerae bacterium]